MVKKMLRLLMLTCVGVILFTGCGDKNYYDPNENPAEIQEGVGDNPSIFNFSTTQSVKLNLNYSVPEGTVSVFDLYTINPLTNGKLRSDVSPISGGINVAGISQLSRVIPSYVEELYVYSPSLFVPLLSYARIENGVASFEQVEIVVPSEAETRAGTAGNLWQRENIKYLKGETDYYMEATPENTLYDLSNPDTIIDIPAEILTAIGQAFPENKQLTETKYLQDATLIVQEGISGTQGAKLYISALHAGCTISNSLSYFVYTGAENDLSKLSVEETAQLEVINVFQLADVNTNTHRNPRWGMTPGKYIQLLYKNPDGQFVEEFPIGAKIGWRLNVGGFDIKNGFVAGTGFKQFFSVPAWNEAKFSNDPNNPIEPGDRNQTIHFAAEDKEKNLYHCFGFEDQNSPGDRDYNDLIFHIETEPSNALVPPPVIDVRDIEHTASHSGVLAYEDQWPKQGDYDLNDVVVKYASTVTYVQTVEIPSGIHVGDATVKKVEDVFSFIHTGAVFNNAFSYKVDINPSKVKRVTIDNVDYSIIPDGNGFVIDLCPNVKSVITPMEFGTTPKVYTVVIEFVDDAVLQSEFPALAAPYNPFISPYETQGAEVHLPMYTPSAKVNMGLFGTFDDRSDMNTLWYVSGENNVYPFAIHLAGVDEGFVVPQEEVKIYTTYPDYSKWVESNMTTNKDWYLHPVQ